VPVLLSWTPGRGGLAVSLSRSVTVADALSPVRVDRADGAFARATDRSGTMEVW